MPERKTEFEILMETIEMFSQDIGMKFGVEKCGMLIMKNYIHISRADFDLFYLFVCLFGFYGISTSVGYIKPNPFYTNFISNNSVNIGTNY